jgi:hypothetical protein
VEKNSQNTVDTKPIPKGLIPWKPGQSGNPGGRPQGLSSYIRQHTKNGEELVTLLLQVARGEEGKFAKWADRLKAIEMLLDRGGWPKAISSPEDGKPIPILDMESLKPEDLDKLEQFGLFLASLRERNSSGADAPKAQ